MVPSTQKVATHVTPFKVTGKTCFLYFSIQSALSAGFPGGAAVKNPPFTAGDSRDMGLIPALGRSAGTGNCNPLQCYCLRNPMDRGAQWPTVHGVAKSGTRRHKWVRACTHRHACTRAWCLRCPCSSALDSELYWAIFQAQSSERLAFLITETAPRSQIASSLLRA